VPQAGVRACLGRKLKALGGVVRCGRVRPRARRQRRSRGPSSPRLIIQARFQRHPARSGRAGRDRAAGSRRLHATPAQTKINHHHAGMETEAIAPAQVMGDIHGVARRQRNATPDHRGGSRECCRTRRSSRSSLRCRSAGRGAGSPRRATPRRPRAGRPPHPRRTRRHWSAVSTSAPAVDASRGPDCGMSSVADRHPDRSRWSVPTGTSGGQGLGARSNILR